MSEILRAMKHFILFFLLLTTSKMCWADMAGLGVFVIHVLMVVLAIWIIVGVSIYFVLHKLPFRKRLGFSGLFLVGPLILFGGNMALEAAVGYPGKPSIELSTPRPVQFFGAVFPAGSRLDYEQDGRFFWMKKLVKAEGSSPVMLGNLQIKTLSVKAGLPEITLSNSQRVGGWFCSGDGWADTTVEIKASEVILVSCRTAIKYQLGGVEWPANTEVTRDDKGGWSLFWQGQGSVDNLGVRVDSMNANYDRGLKLTKWSGSVFGENIEVGGYVFDGKNSPVSFELLIDGRIKIQGAGRGSKTSEAISCLNWLRKTGAIESCTG
ncbi:hypothetical protein [Jeongeupia naejangsanensis]|uniref:Uncharacterized protein n=1 Tax=Jeongeupia naejangsanensis TaxID=613195 RepID=A0ABS2BJJ3_9NEIS|nr:hypothetical protein [Jeongeupia naejangsanensis]MBM3115785.1 hypothetical protein [Jeongeupia naejangsanensis]